MIVVGHVRYKAAQKLGLDKVPAHVATAQIRACRLADINTAEKIADPVAGMAGMIRHLKPGAVTT